MGLFDRKSGSKAVPAEPASSDALLAEARDKISEKQNDINVAKAEATIIGRKPDWTDLMLQITKRAVAEGHAGTPADFRNFANGAVDYSSTKGGTITFSDFNINQKDMEPSRAMRKAAVSMARQANPNGPRDAVAQMQMLQKLQRGEVKMPDENSPVMDLYSLDDDMIAPLYHAVEHQAKFHGTVFEKVNFHPAGTLMRDDDQHQPITRHAIFNNCVFDGLEAGDHVLMRPGHFNNMTVINAHGGTLEFGPGAHAEGVKIQSGTIKLQIDHHAHLGNLTVEDGASVIDFKVQPGGEVSDSVIHGATLSMNSKLEGSRWTRVDFNRTSMVGVEMDGATLTNGNFTDCAMNGVSLRGATLTAMSFDAKSIDGVDLRGAKIQNLTVNGKLITRAEELVTLGVKVDAGTKVTTTQQAALDAKLQGVPVSFDWTSTKAQPSQGLVTDNGLGAAAQALVHQENRAAQVVKSPSTRPIDGPDIRTLDMMKTSFIKPSDIALTLTPVTLSDVSLTGQPKAIAEGPRPERANADVSPLPPMPGHNRRTNA